MGQRTSTALQLPYKAAPGIVKISTPEPIPISKLTISNNKWLLKEKELNWEGTMCLVFSTDLLCGKFWFEFSFPRLKKMHVFIGVSDSNYSCEHYTNKMGNNRLCYDTEGSLCEAGSKIENAKCMNIKGSSKVLTMIGDMDKGLIEWSSEGEMLCAYTWNKLFDKSIEWNAYLLLFMGQSVVVEKCWPAIELVPTFLSLSLYEWDDDLIYEICKCWMLGSEVLTEVRSKVVDS